jgi:plasmid replication initiation protein
MAEKEEKTFELKLNSDYYVVTANDLIKGRQKMSLREAQLLYIAMAQVVKEDKDFKTYTTTVPELAAFMGIDPNSLYRDLEGICTNLLQRVVKIQIGGENARGRKKWKAFQWINCAEYDNGVLTIRLSDDIKPFLIDLVSHYSQSLLGTLCTFSSYYATRLYQLIVCEHNENPNRPKEEWEFTCEQIRDFFQIGEKQYKLPRNLLNFTIIPAIKDLNNSPYAYIWDYEELHAKGRGRALIGVKFKAKIFRNQEEKDWYFNRALPLMNEINAADCSHGDLK